MSVAATGEGAIPVLHRRIIVERCAEGEIGAEERSLPGPADIRIVPSELPRHAVIGRLDEGADSLLRPDRAGVEKARLIQLEIIVGAEPLIGARHRRLRMGEARLDHRCNGREPRCPSRPLPAPLNVAI